MTITCRKLNKNTPVIQQVLKSCLLY